jgi:aldehyde dehydrogenase (NAD+)
MADGSKATARAGVEPFATSNALDEKIDAIRSKQLAFFKRGATLPQSFREEQLRALEASILANEKLLHEALHADLHKSEAEAYIAETSHLRAEARHARKKLGRWMRPRRNLSPIAIAPSRSAIHYQPLGLNLIIAPWNYPIELALGPLVGAIAAGNVAVIKPSELTPASSAAIAKVVAETFDEEFVAVIEGGVEASQALLRERWDHIFFTGGTGIGRIVAKAGAEHLTRVTLELGGKSPTIVTETAELDIAAKRIAFGKWFNAGQTCIAPDYVLAHRSIHDELVRRIGDAIKQFFGDDPQQSEDYGRIVNERHFDRVRALIDTDKVKIGGQTDRKDRYIAPTVMTGVTMDDPVMAEEIFGPVLPVIEIESLDQAMELVDQRPNPLALYLFTTNSSDEKTIVERVSFGGGCINNAAVHFLDSKLPFGGVGESGAGGYHGFHSFEVFSHRKGVVKTSNFIDPSVKYPPFAGKLDLMRRLLG